MRAIICAAIAAALVLIAPPLTQAQVGVSHFRAWDRYEGKNVRKKRAYKRVAATRHFRSKKPTRPMLQRIAPAVADTPPAKLANVVKDVTDAAEQAANTAVDVAETAIKTPFGIVINLFASRAHIPNEVGQFLTKVQKECGKVTVISTLRRGARIAGTGRTSCHAMGQAVDYQVANPACALKLARGVRLGHSIDYYGVRALYGRGMPVHYHVSNCRQEMGAKFAHGGGRKIHTRYAARNKVRYTKRWKHRTKKVRYAMVRR